MKHNLAVVPVQNPNETGLQTQPIADFPLQTADFTARALRDAGHTPRRPRPIFPQPLTTGVLDRSVAALWPWSYGWQYPGAGKLRGWLLGVKPATGSDYRKAPLPKVRRRFLADRLEAKARELLALVAELREGLEPIAENRSRVRSKVPPPRV